MGLAEVVKQQEETEQVTLEGQRQGSLIMLGSSSLQMGEAKRTEALAGELEVLLHAKEELAAQTEETEALMLTIKVEQDRGQIHTSLARNLLTH